MRILSPFSTVFIFLTCAVIGINLVVLLNYQLTSSRTMPSISIQFEWPNNSPRGVEAEVTSKVEAVCARISGVKNIHSKSEQGRGEVTVYADKYANMEWIRFEVSSAVRQLWSNMPAQVSYPTIQVASATTGQNAALLTYSLTASASNQVVGDYANDFLKTKIAKVSGVDHVLVDGVNGYEWVIQYNESALQKYGLSCHALEQILKLHLASEGIGVGEYNARKGALHLPIRYQTKVGVSKLSRVALKKHNGKLIYLNDIATVHRREANPRSHYRINGQSTVTLRVFPAEDTNQIQVGNSIHDLVVRLEKNLPQGYALTKIHDSNEYLLEELHKTVERFAFACGALFLLVFLFYRDVKYLLLIVLTFLSNISIAVIFYYLFKVEIHLYSLSAITVSLGFICDNVLIMSDHIRTQANRKVGLSIISGFIIMLGSLSLVAFMGDKIKSLLFDFVLVVIINQAVSVAVALLLVPALMQKFNLLKRGSKPVTIARKRLYCKGWFWYKQSVVFVRKRQIWIYTLLLLSFGIPTFYLPLEWEGEAWYHKWYTATIGSRYYTENLRTPVDKLLGGSLRLFVEHVFTDSQFTNNNENKLYAYANLPNGSTLKQANYLARRVELFLQKYQKIKWFDTSITPTNIVVTIQFNNSTESKNFPHQLRTQLVAYVLKLAGANWGVYGVGQVFSNNSQELGGESLITLKGYNYELLDSLSEQLKAIVLRDSHVKEVTKLAKAKFLKSDHSQLVVRMNKDAALLGRITPNNLYQTLLQSTVHNEPFNYFYGEKNYESVRLEPSTIHHTNLWDLENNWLNVGGSKTHFNAVSNIVSKDVPMEIIKENQEYKQTLQFDYIGGERKAKKFCNRVSGTFKASLPIGYSIIPNDTFFTSTTDTESRYWLLFVLAAIVFFVCAILFESFRFPVAVLLEIPISYMGVFLTFYWFQLNFDQGGFASFVLLSGITVNLSNYIICDYTNLVKGSPEANSLSLYIKAFRHKLVPCTLTIVSTIIGFLPFLLFDTASFWFSMSVGVIGGLVFTLLGVFLFLPLFLGIGKEWKMVS